MKASLLRLSIPQRQILEKFASDGLLAVPADDVTRRLCEQLSKMKFLRRQPFIDGHAPVNDAKVGIAFRITAAGKLQAEAIEFLIRHSGSAKRPIKFKIPMKRSRAEARRRGA